MWADGRSTALLASTLELVVDTTAALLAGTPLPSMCVYRRAAALLTSTLVPTVRTDLRATAVLTIALLPSMRAKR